MIRSRDIDGLDVKFEGLVGQMCKAYTVAINSMHEFRPEVPCSICRDRRVIICQRSLAG